MTATQHTVHRIDIGAAPDLVFQIIADAADWPLHFGPTIHVDRTALDSPAERLSIWATANDDVKHWTSRRDVDREAGKVAFRQEVSAPPVASMGGEWIVEAGPDGCTRLTLTHDFTAVDDDPAHLDWIGRATDRNSRTELANIKTLAEEHDRTAALTFSFEDSVLVDGAPEAVYEFLYDAARWPDRLPHVGDLKVREEVPGIQVMTMDTRAADGSVHTTESVRVCFPAERIVYKQTLPPALMTAHVGEWTVAKTADGVLATSRHTVTVREEAVETVLGAGATVQQAKDFIRKAAGGNSAATLGHAKTFVEAG
ncbi:aromatase/cyclase [Actinoallomurus sp. CA-150999]|uniref:aromatase/cyclase n=1 Tax=Actinoallomurus sp. CA-150999 TaxID=3239887 RepID=UPI003D8A2C74